MTLERVNIKVIFGWALLIAGILIICWALFSSYGIFSGKTEPPQIFADRGQIEKETELGGTTSQDQMREEMQQIVGKQIENMIPSFFVSQILNLISWSVFAAILILGGGKISLLGIRLIKK